MELLTITIGRNIGSEPMPAQDWSQFKSDIRQLGEVAGEKTGLATWQGVTEQSVSIELWAEADRLRRELPTLARKYHQDGIGLWHGEVIEG